MQHKSRKIEQGDTTRDALIEAARELFGTQGYADTSLDAVVRRAGVTKGALYHHFAGKEALFRVVYEAVKRDLSRTLSGTLGLQDDAAVWRDLLDRCRDYIHAHTEPCVQRIVLIDARSVLSWRDIQRIESSYGVVLIRAALRRATNRGIITPLPLHALATIVTGALNEACTLVANAADQPTALEEAIAIVEQLVAGLQLPPAETPQSRPPGN